VIKLLKILGSFFVIIPFGVMGIIIGKNFSKRPEQIRQLQFGLQALETEIMYSATPLPQAMEKVAKQVHDGPISQLFLQTGRELLKGEGQTATEAWSEAVKNMKDYLLFTEIDLTILEQFGQGLGTSDRQDQLKRLTVVRAHLEGREKEAEKEKFQFQKVWQVLGWALGLVITLLFL
jgi:stage III sporulation protein AB